MLDNKTFLEETIRNDTIYFLKTKYFNNSWPKESTYFKLSYVENRLQAKMINFGPSYPYDKRERISVLKFEKKKDTVSVLMLSYGGNLYFTFNLVKKNNEWNIVKSYVETGGRQQYYGFEREKWYLNLKNKIKEKPIILFPPPEPRN